MERETYFIHINLDGDWCFSDLYCYPKDVKPRTKAKLKAKRFNWSKTIHADVWKMSDYDSGRGEKLFTNLT